MHVKKKCGVFRLSEGARAVPMSQYGPGPGPYGPIWAHIGPLWVRIGPIISAYGPQCRLAQIRGGMHKPYTYGPQIRGGMHEFNPQGPLNRTKKKRRKLLKKI